MDHSFYTANTPYLPLPRKHSPDVATTESNSSQLIAAYYSFIDPKGMKGWVNTDPKDGDVLQLRRKQLAWKKVMAA